MSLNQLFKTLVATGKNKIRMNLRKKRKKRSLKKIQEPIGSSRPIRLIIVVISTLQLSIIQERLK